MKLFDSFRNTFPCFLLWIVLKGNHTTESLKVAGIMMVIRKNESLEILFLFMEKLKCLPACLARNSELLLQRFLS